MSLKTKKNGGSCRRYRRKDKPKQTTYGAISMIALFAAALFIESIPAVSALCLAVIVFCLIKGQLWEFKEERSECNERHNAQNKRIYRYPEYKEHA